ncbi:MAG: hypothetical protein LBQ59_01905 [Candidatus Peribacteria bacterium]|nr:hypothetical protein [Candidatus Peribacteria bacterium]
MIPKIIAKAENSPQPSAQTSPQPSPFEGEGVNKILPPKFCPSCGTEVKKDENKVRYYCPNNIDCPAQHIEKLIFAVGKQGFDIDGF